MIKEEETRRIAGSIPGARMKFIFIEEGHFIAAQAYKAFNEAVEEFLKDAVGEAASAGEGFYGA